MNPTPKQARGFALMTPEKLAEIARQGGRAAHALGTAHTWDKDAARAAGRKGGVSGGKKRRARLLAEAAALEDVDGL